MGGRPSAVRVSGPFAAHAAGFRRELERVGYRPNAVRDQLRLMAHASRWLEAGGLGADELTPAGWRSSSRTAVGRATGCGCRPGRWSRCSSTCAALAWSQHRRRSCRSPRPRNFGRTTGAYLVQERGLAAGTVAGLTARGQVVLRGAGRGWRAAPRSAERGGGDRLRARRVRVPLGRLGQVRRVRAAVAASLPVRRRPHRGPARGGGAEGGGLAPRRRAGQLRPRRGGPPARQLRSADHLRAAGLRGAHRARPPRAARRRGGRIGAGRPRLAGLGAGGAGQGPAGGATSRPRRRGRGADRLAPPGASTV
jgi:hypothetical protein